jgi:glycosyltransferase 2 family protein
VLLFGLSVAGGGAALYWSLARFQVAKAAHLITSARIDLYGLAVVLMIAGYFVRGGRWIVWHRNLGYWDSFYLILIGLMGNNILPARLGELMRAHYAAAAGRSGRTGALAAIAAERILDGFVIALIGLAGATVVPMDVSLRSGLLFVCGAFILLTTLLVASLYMHVGLREVFHGLATAFPNRFTKLADEKFSFFLDGMMPLKSVRKLVLGLIATAGVWGLELGSFYLFTRSVHQPLSFPVCMALLAVVNFASLFPLAQGGFGAIEFTAATFLASTGVAPERAILVISIQHVTQFLFVTLAGIACFWRLRFKLNADPKRWNLATVTTTSDATG